MASQTKDRGITIGVDIMDMSISWECSTLFKPVRTLPPITFGRKNAVCFLPLLHVFKHFKLDLLMEVNTHIMNPAQTAYFGAI